MQFYTENSCFAFLSHLGDLKDNVRWSS